MDRFCNSSISFYEIYYFFLKCKLKLSVKPVPIALRHTPLYNIYISKISNNTVNQQLYYCYMTPLPFTGHTPHTPSDKAQFRVPTSPRKARLVLALCCEI